MESALEAPVVPEFFYSGNNTNAFLLMASALGLKDRYTHAHAHRVAEYAKRLAVRAGLSMEEVLHVSIGGMLHDVGKLGLSDKIFTNQSAVLSDDMMQEVYNHPLIGSALVRTFTCQQAISDAVLFHHERLDGSGYPFGLKGDEIPLSARIVSIADCFDAITTDRPYQRRKSCKAAIALLTAGAGIYFAPDLVPLFVNEIKINGTVRHTRFETLSNPFPQGR